MSETTKRIIYDLLQYRRAAIDATQAFLYWKHDADLCPKFQQKIETAFTAIEKYQTITYDIQGPRDSGTDIILREPQNGDYEYVCFQIKSHDDLREKDYLKILKAQYFDSKRLYNTRLKDYYIVVCASLVTEDPKTKTLILDKSMKGRTRTISGEFSLEQHVHVIEPEYAVAFLRLGLVQIDAVVKRRFCEGDVVLIEAMRLVGDLTPTETALLVFIIWKRIQEDKQMVSIEEIKNSEFLQDVYSNAPDLEREAFFFSVDDIEDYEDRKYYQELQRPRNLDLDTRIIYDLEHLNGEHIELYDANKYSVRLTDVQPLVVTMMDGSVRFDYEGTTLLEYVMNVIRDPV